MNLTQRFIGNKYDASHFIFIINFIEKIYKWTIYFSQNNLF